MRPNFDHLEGSRRTDLEIEMCGKSMKGERCGFFVFRLLFDTELRVIVSDGTGWKFKKPIFEHISVSTINRTPTWGEMCMVKDMFWKEDELVVQYHPTRDQYINCHPYTLHLWKPVGVKIPIPPLETVGPREFRK